MVRGLASGGAAEEFCQSAKLVNFGNIRFFCAFFYRHVSGHSREHRRAATCRADAKKACPGCGQAFFVVKQRLLCGANKPSLRGKQALFCWQTRLLCGGRGVAAVDVSILLVYGKILV